MATRSNRPSRAVAPAAASRPGSAVLPVLAVAAGIGVFSMMDAAMKAASLAMGVGTALLLRNVFAALLTLPLWLAAGRPLPTRRVLIVHAQRAGISAAMASLFFYGLTRIPMAEGIALSFISPIIALYLASLLLGERIRPRAIAASLLGIVGVLVIGAGRFGGGTYSHEALVGTLAILASAMFYAVNLVFQRKQALLAGPVEIAQFQNLILALIFLAFSPLYWTVPDTAGVAVTFIGGLLATMALLFLSWGYARAEAQVLVPIEYTAFGWAALLGWLFFGETISIATLAGTAMIVLGCWIGTQNHAKSSQV
ncbi:hypothetical protein WSK_2126 [Novosphingobium sp. Rr 2-17]|uniref:DMT family transporter n=1 Tax=Novosphingobium sp. Rr 2-17 TaxID=555793 RepID=UPI0002698ED3|nr:hypothetical protein WSK_2126 [Novosphingobium sp. Rr 2-17]